jgi:hypothetical protein
VEAWCYEGEESEFPDWIKPYALYTNINDEQLNIITPDGVLKAKIGDWVLREDSGIVFPMNRTYFESYYESVS